MVFVVLSIVPLLVFNWTIVTIIRDYHMEVRIEELRQNGNQVAIIAESHGLSRLEQWLGIVQNQISDLSQEWDVRILVISDRAQVLRDSNHDVEDTLVGTTLFLPEVFSALNRQEMHVLRRDEYVLNMALSIRDEADDRVGAVLLAADVSDIFYTVNEIRDTLLLYSLAVGLLVIVLVFFMSHRMIASLRQIMKVVQRMAAGQLNVRSAVTSKDEYSVLSKAFNSMAEKLEQHEKTRDEFVSNVSHEIKTPLSAIKVLSESILTLESVPEDVYREFFQDINNEVDRMTNINNDLLALVKVDQREQSLNLAPVNLNELVEDILKRLSPLAEKKKVVLLYEEARLVDIDADDVKLALAISNIVENGIKYTPRGGTVKVVVDSDHQFASITIQDTGIGIPEDEQDKIFNRFYRVDKTRDRDTGGTGLGLAIARSTVLLHNGNIKLTSKPEEGSVFTMRLPIRK